MRSVEAISCVEIVDSVRAFKKAHKLGRFADKVEEQEEQDPVELNEQSLAADMTSGARCEVVTGDFTKRGSVRFVGPVSFAKGVWVGVEYDEPVGKHNGTYLEFH